MVQNRNLNDREISNALLVFHKLGAEGLTHLVLESGNRSIRQDATQVLQKTFDHQKSIWDYMNQKGFYPVEMAQQQDVSRAQQHIQSMQGAGGR